MLFVTNRTPKQSARSKQNRPITFPLSNNDVSQSVYYCIREDKDQYIEIGAEPFMEALRDDAHKQVLFLIHGFNMLPEAEGGVFEQALKLQELFDTEENLVQVIPLMWPCDSDIGIVKDYWDDQKSADKSGFSFARVLQKFLGWRDETQPCTKRINVLAHSMGNRVLRETIRVWDRYDLARGVPQLFRNVFMVASDVVNETLAVGQPGKPICDSTRNVIVYFASDDLALRASKVSNLKNQIASRRLGHTGPEDINAVPRNVYAVDCDDFNNSYDSPKGHTYFLEAPDGSPGLAFRHILQIVQRGRVFPGDEDRRTEILGARASAEINSDRKS